ncbi:MAG: site-2 protease family protein [Balneolaceae bacterium]
MPFPQPYDPTEETLENGFAPEPSKNRPDAKTILKHTALFVATFVCVTYVGMMIWVGQSAGVESYTEMWPQGVLFAVLLLGFLATHEFGHYFAAVYHKIKVSLPYFIPIPIGIGTMGAVISIRERIKTTTKLFDVGISGPIAGFIVSLFILLYGFATLPDPSFMENFAGHDELITHINETGTFPETPPADDQGVGNIVLGNTLLFSFLASFFSNVPPMYEMYHYPFLFAGWLGLFFTALNLMPVGQLDGGHILYSLIGYEKHKKFARICFGLLTALAGTEAIPFFYQQIAEHLPNYGHLSTVLWAMILFFLLRKAFHQSYEWISATWILSLVGSVGYLYFFAGGFEQVGSLIWVVWCFFIAYFVKVEHPPVVYEEPLSPTRRYLGWISMAVFILCISPSPISIIN